MLVLIMEPNIFINVPVSVIRGGKAGDGWQVHFTWRKVQLPPFTLEVSAIGIPGCERGHGMKERHQLTETLRPGFSG